MAEPKTTNIHEITEKGKGDNKIIALAGNPNVGKSTVFNALTGQNQHTGNWPGKTVSGARGEYKTGKYRYTLVDTPGTYSLFAHSAEEEVARDYICFGGADVTVVVCDATCLERNLNLVLQITEFSEKTVVCVNLMDEAKRKHIDIDLDALSARLGVPVVGASARRKSTLCELLSAVDRAAERSDADRPYRVRYPDAIEDAIAPIASKMTDFGIVPARSRSYALKLIGGNEDFKRQIDTVLCTAAPTHQAELSEAIACARNQLLEAGITPENFDDILVSSLVSAAEEIARDAIRVKEDRSQSRDRKIDRVVTGRIWAYPLMLFLLAGIFWITTEGANYPSELLADGLFWVQERLSDLFVLIGAPEWLHGMLVLGAYRVLAFVVSVMLPPMAIFFPLFTLLEDSGYLPRIAYNLDKPFKCCRACGKQALTMCMGFGCNAVGVTGCRIIDSPRERLLAILTNTFVPCNGRFPTLIALISMFFAFRVTGWGSSVISSLGLTAVILLGVGMTFLVTRLLSSTVLRGVPSSFTIELPPYRRPDFGRVIIRSVFDRTLFVLGRAAAVAAPAGMILWILANVQIGGVTLISYCSDFLDPFAGLMGLDGVILMAFILGFPANEIVLPIILMAYMAQGTLGASLDMETMRNLLVGHGWSTLTALNTMLFSLMHWPCSATLLTIKKETGSIRWTLLAAAIPTVCGMVICMLNAAVAGMFGLC